MHRIPSFIISLLALAALLSFAGCHSDYDDYTTQAVVTIDVPDSISVDRMQGTVTFTNLNSRQTTTAASFSGTAVQAELLRGAYAISVEGSLRYTTSRGTTQTGTFRAATSYAEVLDHPAIVHLDMIMM